MAGSVHDTYTKAVFSRRENANGLFKAVLPPALLASLDLSSTEYCAGSYAGVTSRHSDLLYKVRLAGREALLYVLLEHKSTVDDPLLPATLLVYMGRIWDQWLRENEAKKPAERATLLPAVIPVVLYHGAEGWTAATELLDVIDLAPDALVALRPHLPSYRFVLDDLVTRTDQDLRARETAVLGRLALLLLRHLRELRTDPPSVLAFLRTVADLFNLLPDEDRVLSFWYILGVAEPDPLAVQSALRDVVEPRVLEGVMTAAEKLRTEGRLDGGRRALLRLLRRLGQVGPELEHRVMTADEPTLDLWLDRVPDASSVEDVFALGDEHQRKPLSARSSKGRKPGSGRRKR